MSGFGKRLDGPSGRRAAGRQPVVLNAAMLAIGASRTAIIRDVSRTGLKLEVNAEMYVGQEVWLKLPPYDIFGKVAWVKGKQCGIRLDEPFTEKQTQLLKASGKAAWLPRLTPDEQAALQSLRSGSLG